MKKYAIILFVLLGALAANAQQKNPFPERTAATESLATKYFNTYMAMDWNKLGQFMHDEITFADPTASLLFGEKNPAGKESVLKNFRDGYASLTNMTPKLTRTFFSGDTGVFELDLAFSFKTRKDTVETVTMPLVVVITVKDGKVIMHRDYGDYRAYLDQIRKLK